MADTTELDARLQEAVEKRTKLAATAERLKGALETARKNRDEIRAECEKKGIDPDNIDDAIKERAAELESQVAQIEQAVAKADKALAPYMKER